MQDSKRSHATEPDEAEPGVDKQLDSLQIDGRQFDSRQFDGRFFVLGQRRQFSLWQLIVAITLLAVIFAGAGQLGRPVLYTLLIMGGVAAVFMGTALVWIYFLEGTDAAVQSLLAMVTLLAALILAIGLPAAILILVLTALND